MNQHNTSTQWLDLGSAAAKNGASEQHSSIAWQDLAVLLARLILVGVFGIAVTFKFIGIGATADYIASIGLPFPLLLAWLAATLEVILILCFLTGAFFSEAALVAAIYVVFLGFAFHGPSHWATNQDEFGFFVDHFTFLAALLFAAAHGTGRVLALKQVRLLPA